MFKQRDPVCGVKVSKNSEHFLKYDQQIYYFDCPACKATFAQDPHRFIKKSKKNFLKWLSRDAAEVPQSCHDTKN